MGGIIALKWQKVKGFFAGSSTHSWKTNGEGVLENVQRRVCETIMSGNRKRHLFIYLFIYLFLIKSFNFLIGSTARLLSLEFSRVTEEKNVRLEYKFH
jgi:hypothetical protein